MDKGKGKGKGSVEQMELSVYGREKIQDGGSALPTTNY